MKKYFKLILAAIIALVFIGTFVFLWKQSQPQPIVYEEFTPEVKDIVRSTIVTGKIEPRDEVNVKPQISGIITNIYKEAGDMVQAGEVIAKVKEEDRFQATRDMKRDIYIFLNENKITVPYPQLTITQGPNPADHPEWVDKEKEEAKAQKEIAKQQEASKGTDEVNEVK